MGDRENLSIPVNLAFLAGLLVVSHLLTVVAPVRTVDAKLPDPPSADMALPAPKPALDKPGPEATMTLAAVTMPKLPTVAMPEATAPKPVSDLARPTADTPGPARISRLLPIPVRRVWSTRHQSRSNPCRRWTGRRRRRRRSSPSDRAPASCARKCRFRHPADSAP